MLQRVICRVGAGLLLCCVACTSKPAQAPQTEFKGFVIALTDSLLSRGGSDTVRFGRMRSGEIAVKELAFANQTQRPVVILSVARSCGCTTLDYENQPIQPRQMQRMSLSYDSRGEYGWQLRTLDVLFAGAQKPMRLFVEAEVE